MQQKEHTQIVNDMEKIRERLKQIALGIKQKIEPVRKNWKPVTVVVVLLIGLIATLYLVQHPIIWKSQAETDIGQVIKIGPDDQVKYEGNKTWTTNSESVEINIEDLSSL